MRLPFTKMHGAGNDFVVLDATRELVHLTPEQLRHLGDRRRGVGADQILLVEASTTPGVDFRYRIFNGASGEEVEHCGNGARCFMRFVHERGLTTKNPVKVETINNVLTLHLRDDGRVTVDMSRPVFEHGRIPFDAAGLTPRHEGDFELWSLDDVAGAEVAVLSMGNPHAVQLVPDVDSAPVAFWGPAIEKNKRFAKHVNVGFLQVVNGSEVRLRVHERDAGETLACGTGACAAVVAGIRLGWLDSRVEVETRGGRLLIEWAGGDSPVFMTGPAQTVFQGEIEL